MTKIGLRLCIEIRFCIDPHANRVIADGMVTGVTALLADLGWACDALDHDWADMSVLERYLFTDTGSLNAVLYSELLRAYQNALRNGLVIDNPHWDVVITSNPLAPLPGAPADYGIACGGKASGASASGALLFTTHGLAAVEPQQARRQAFLAGYHTASFLTEPARCQNADCVYSAGIRHQQDMQTLMAAFVAKGRVPACPQHQDHTTTARRLDEYESPLRNWA